ncbi:MAG: ABC transporter ATP-binding protein [Candidatus Bathyarchaeia archaeon]
MKLEVKNLTFAYQSTPVLNGICMEAEQMVTALIGPNAAGKSTLLKCMSGLLKSNNSKKQAGSILLDGRDTKVYTRDDFLRAVSYLPQDAPCSSALTVFEAVLLGRMNSLGWKVSDEDLKLALDAMEKLGIEGLAKRSMGELSGGQKQMVSIAQSIIRKPAVLLMDEPTNSLDLQHQLELFELIKMITKENKMTTVVALHDLNLAARYADKIVLMNLGKIEATGKPESVITVDMIRNIYGVNARVMTDDEGIPQVIPIKSARKCVTIAK